MYSLLESIALKQLGIKIIQYRPHLVQHIDNDTFLFKGTDHLRRSPWFKDYLDELGISYKEAKEYRMDLLEIMKNHFKKSIK